MTGSFLGHPSGSLGPTKACCSHLGSVDCGPTFLRSVRQAAQREGAVRFERVYIWRFRSTFLCEHYLKLDTAEFWPEQAVAIGSWVIT